ncbi:PREDICTED: aspartic proteinase CDR1-like [Nelumbo nucifera]|uniref:Peptidase A1 domain-containing protein n=2 Tax=Nelumbo nucifera TaxID=4432 RepID=A0A822Y5R6_NELNU|nr:PREDICTED: aspartic proteinase CDR1-like [Nelumbo nucifera]DAD24948.1 TPA_asm: hypothetical protein HUJ06_026412 [Nelumbo nucifera]
MATNNLTVSPLHILILFFSIYLSSYSLIEASHGGFSINLIHRDSSLSPFYNHSESPSQRMQNAFHRSITRVNRFKQPKLSPATVRSVLIPNEESGEYLMKLLVGTPPSQVLAIADTGSDLIWTQCKPCAHCYKQKRPLFDPKNSSTYRNLPCKSKPCKYLESRFCSRKGNLCEYWYTYGDGSMTKGNVAADTFTLASTNGRSVALPKMVFGCSHYSHGSFGEQETGVVGLGRGSLSLISQLGSLADGKFSYCLVPMSKENASSTLSFGRRAVVSGKGVVSTPLVWGEDESFYYLTLEGFSVGDKKLTYSKYPSAKSGKTKESGNIIIDSGTTLTFLPEELFNELESAVKDEIDLEPVPDPHKDLKLCFRTRTDIKVPTITAHFTGADVQLKAVNTFVRIADDVVCLAMLPSQFSIFGNLAQINFLVGYDIIYRKVSFMPTDCTKH